MGVTMSEPGVSRLVSVDIERAVELATNIEGMEFGLREYLMILAAVLIVGMLADGIRRTLKHKREGLKLDLMAAPPESPERGDVSKPRPVKKAIPEELEPNVDVDPLFESSDANQLNLWAGEIKPEVMKTADTRTSGNDGFRHADGFLTRRE